MRSLCARLPNVFAFMFSTPAKVSWSFAWNIRCFFNLLFRQIDCLYSLHFLRFSEFRQNAGSLNRRHACCSPLGHPLLCCDFYRSENRWTPLHHYSCLTSRIFSSRRFLRFSNTPIVETKYIFPSGMVWHELCRTAEPIQQTLHLVTRLHIFN